MKKISRNITQRLFQSESILLILLILIINFNYLIAQRTTLTKITPYQDTIIIFQFDGNIKYTNELDSNKTKITIIVSNSLISNTVNNFQNIGNISQIASKTKNNNTIIEIFTKNPTGYTTFFDKITKKLYLFLFNWKELNEAEDLFHTGLLALEDELDSIGFDYLYKSLQRGYYDASSIISLTELIRGNLNRAFKYSEISEYTQTTFPQVLLLRSSIYKFRGDSINAKTLENKYRQLATNENINLTLPKTRSESDTLTVEEIRLIDSLCQNLMNTTKDTLDPELARFNQIFDTTKVTTNNQEQQKTFFESIPLWIQIASGILFAGIMLLLYYYFRWRTLQLKAKMSKERQKAIEKSQKQKSKATAPPKPKVPASAINQKYASKSQEQEIKPEEIKENIQPITPEKASQIEAALNAIKEEKFKEQQQQIQEKHPSTQRSDAKIEIATNLINEQKKIKQQKLSSIPPDIITKSEKIKQIANELGIEEKSIEIKKSVESLLKNTQNLDKLQKKL